MLMDINGRSAKNRLQRLRCSVQKYDWGRYGSNSEVAKLYSENSGVKIDWNKPYAEFWMGTHESGPSFLVSNSENGACGDMGCVTLKCWINKNPNVLGDKVLEKWGCDLPFLFKVLSIRKPLSIQAHPDKILAKKLHESQPDVYKDDNHKPEMALALTEFEALCGFLDIKAMKAILQNAPELRDLVGDSYMEQVLKVDEEDEDKVKAAVRLLFTQIMSASKGIVAEVLSKLKNNLSLKMKHELTFEEHLVLRLEEQYPSDVGVIAALFLNYVKLQPGQALSLGANEPHAYISGDCIECMATSDNVVRAGLTPKRRDVWALCNMLSYKLGYPDILEGVEVNEYTRKYRPSFEEFEVDRCVIPMGKTVKFLSISGPSIFLIRAGKGRIRTGSSVEEIGSGDVLFAPAYTEINIESDEPSLELYRAGVNSEYL